MSQDVLGAVHHHLEILGQQFLEALDGIPDDDLNTWKPAAEHTGGGDMNTLAAMSVHTVHAAGWRIVHQVFGHAYPRDRESEFTATATLREIESLFEHLLTRFAELMEAQPDIDLTALPPTIRETTPDWDRLAYLTSIISHTALHLGHAQITRQLWLAERDSANQQR